MTNIRLHTRHYSHIGSYSTCISIWLFLIIVNFYSGKI